MPFIASNGLTEEGTSRTAQANGMTVHYHDVGEGEPIVLLHSYGPGTTAWITWYKVLPALSQRYRCIAMDLPNFAKTGPVIYDEPVHDFQAKTALALMDELGIDRAHVIGNSQGGQSSMVFAYKYPDRINKLVWGAGHIGTAGGYPNEYLISNPHEEGGRAAGQASADPTLDNFLRYVRLHIVDEAQATEELADYLLRQHTGRADLVEARKSARSEPHDHSRDMMTITAPCLLIWGRNDRMCTFEIGINALNLTPNSRLVVLRDTGHWPPFEKPAEYAAHVLTFLQGY